MSRPIIVVRQPFCNECAVCKFVEDEEPLGAIGTWCSVCTLVYNSSSCQHISTQTLCHQGKLGYFKYSSTKYLTKKGV